MSPEELLTHNRVKGEISRSLATMLIERRLGAYFHDRTLVTNVEANLSTEPDGTFVSYDAKRQGRVRWVKGAEGFVEIEGTPGMVLEVVSASSVRKDTVVLRELYWLAGIPEYWLVDARRGSLQFDLLVRGRTGYAPARVREGWRRSRVFDASFRLVSGKDELGDPEYLLEVR
jgi:Uma2 family endonuclease